MKNGHRLQDSMRQSFAAALDAYLRVLATLFDRQSELVAALTSAGFLAHSPFTSPQDNAKQRLRKIKQELLKESIARRAMIVDGARRTIGYSSAMIEGLCKALNITRDLPDGSLSPRDYLPRIAPEIAEEWYGVSTLLGEEQVRLRLAAQHRFAQEAMGRANASGLMNIAGKKRSQACFEMNFAERGFRIERSPNSWSDLVLAAQVTDAVALHVIVPQSGPRQLEHVPRSNPMVVRPWFGADYFSAAGVEPSIGYDWLAGTHVAKLVPGFSVYENCQSWDFFVRGTEAFALLYRYIEPVLIEACTAASTRVHEEAS